MKLLLNGLDLPSFSETKRLSDMEEHKVHTTVDIPFRTTPALARLIGETIRHGVIHMLIPPVDIIQSWIDRDLEDGSCHFSTEEDLHAFLDYMEDLANPPSENPDGESSSETHSEPLVPDEDPDGVFNDLILPRITSFSKNISERTISALLERMMPYCMESKAIDADNLSSSLQSIHPTKKAKDIEPEIKELLFDLCVTFKTDLESPESKILLDKMKEGDGSFTDYHELLESLMERYSYSNIAIPEAVSRLLPIYMNHLDDIMQEICTVVHEGVLDAVEQAIMQERQSIPGPHCLE